MKQDSFAASNPTPNLPLKFPPLPTKSKPFYMNSHSQPPHLHPTMPRYNPEIPRSSFQAKDHLTGRNLPASFKVCQPINFNFRNNFKLVERAPALNRINEVADSNLRNPSIEKTVQMASTKDNFSKTAKKTFKLQGSFEKLPQSNQSLPMNSISFPNLDEESFNRFRESLVDLKGKSPVPSNHNFKGPSFPAGAFNKQPSISGFKCLPSENDFNPFKASMIKWPKHLHLDEAKKFSGNSLVNLEPFTPKLAKNQPSFSNFDYFQVQNRDRKAGNEDKVMHLMMPSFPRNKLNGKFPSINALHSEKELEPVLGKRDQMKPLIDLPSLNKNYKKLNEVSSEAFFFQNQNAVVGDFPEAAPPKPNPIKFTKPGSMTSLDGNRVPAQERR